MGQFESLPESVPDSKRESDRDSLIPKWLENINTKTEHSIRDIVFSEDKLDLLNVFLRDNISLLKLEFDNNKIGDAGVAQLAKALMVNTTLQSLSITNNDISSKGCDELAEVLKCNRHLTELNLVRNNISDNAGVQLGEAIKINSTLVILNLSHNQISDNGMKEIAKGISKNTTLLNLNLSDNQIKNLTPLSVALRHNTVLQELDLSKNKVDDEALASLGDSLKSNTGLKTILLHGNPFRTKGIIELQMGLEELNTVKKLSLNKYIYTEPVKLASKCQFIPKYSTVQGQNSLVLFNTDHSTCVSNTNLLFKYGALTTPTERIVFKIKDLKEDCHILFGLADPAEFSPKEHLYQNSGYFIEVLPSKNSFMSVKVGKMLDNVQNGDKIGLEIDKTIGHLLLSHNGKNLGAVEVGKEISKLSPAICFASPCEIEIVEGMTLLPGQKEVQLK